MEHINAATANKHKHYTKCGSRAIHSCMGRTVPHTDDRRRRRRLVNRHVCVYCRSNRGADDSPSRHTTTVNRRGQCVRGTWRADNRTHRKAQKRTKTECYQTFVAGSTLWQCEITHRPANKCIYVCAHVSGGEVVDLHRLQSEAWQC